MEQPDNPFRSSQVVTSLNEVAIVTELQNVSSDHSNELFTIHLGWMFASLAGFIATSTTILWLPRIHQFYVIELFSNPINAIILSFIVGAAASFAIASVIYLLSFRVRLVLFTCAVVGIFSASLIQINSLLLVALGLFPLVLLYISAGLLNQERSAKILGIVVGVLTLPIFCIVSSYLVASLGRALFNHHALTGDRKLESRSRSYLPFLPIKYFVLNLFLGFLLVPMFTIVSIFILLMILGELSGGFWIG